MRVVDEPIDNRETQRLVHETRDSPRERRALRRAQSVGGFLGDQLYFRMGPLEPEADQRLRGKVRDGHGRVVALRRAVVPREDVLRCHAQPARELHGLDRGAHLGRERRGTRLERLGRSGERDAAARARGGAARATP